MLVSFKHFCCCLFTKKQKREREREREREKERDKDGVVSELKKGMRGELMGLGIKMSSGTKLPF